MSVKELHTIKKADAKAEAALQKARQQGEEMVEKAIGQMTKEIDMSKEKIKQIINEREVAWEGYTQIGAYQVSASILHKIYSLLHRIFADPKSLNPQWCVCPETDHIEG